MLKFVLTAIIICGLICEVWWLTLAALVVLNYIEKQEHYEQTEKIKRLIEELVDKK